MNKNIGQLIAAAIMMYLLFVASPMQLNPDLQKNAKLTTEKINADCREKGSSCEELFKGLTIQLQKANTEIQERLNQETEWFKLKHYVVGVLLLGFLAHAYLDHSSNYQTKHDEIAEKFDNSLKSPVTSFIISLTIIVAVSIDMQIRAGRIVINQLGTWIGYYVEPILLSSREPASLGWEQFLRIEGGYHANNIYAMIFWTNIYYLSIILYVLYLVVSRNSLSTQKTNQKQKIIVWFGFWMLHITLLVCALSNHVVPFTFRVTLFPLLTGWRPEYLVHPAWLILVYSVCWGCLVMVASRYINKRTEAN